MLDGIQNKIDPGKPMDANIYTLSEKDKANIHSVPGSLADSLKALEEDHDFLTKNGVFTSDVIETYTDYKKEYEISELALRPHPYEFALYYDN